MCVTNINKNQNLHKNEKKLEQNLKLIDFCVCVMMLVITYCYKNSKNKKHSVTGFTFMCTVIIRGIIETENLSITHTHTLATQKNPEYV